MAFDPTAPASKPMLWVSNNAPTLENSLDWSGKITRMSGDSLETVQDYVVGLPRATKDHMTNSMAFGPDGALYVMQGSRSANGAYDNARKGDEHLLNAAVLRVDRNAISAPPALNVKTEDDGAYDPYAPTTPATLPAACQERPDKAVFGPYTGPAVTGFSNNALAQPDFLYRVIPGKYYGHPDPKRCEWVLNGGNPASGTDYLEELQYPVGTQPDRNWQKPEFVLGMHYSPNGTIEYKSNAFGGTLKGRLMVVRYSVGKDILVLTVDNASKKITLLKPRP